MEKIINVVQYGLGAMGKSMVRLVANKANLMYVGAVSKSGRYSGMDLGEVSGLRERLGITVTSSLEKALEGIKVDVLLHATVSTMKELIPEILPAVRAGLNIVSVAEELSYPWERSPDLASELDRAAKKHGVTVLGTGLNPGFLMDLLPLNLSGLCGSLTAVRVRRVNDFSVYGQTVIKHIGANLIPKEFESGLQDGSIVLHVGLPESIQMVAKGLGWKLDQMTEEQHALVSHTDRSAGSIKIEAGRVCGFHQKARGQAKRNTIELEIFGIILPNPSEDGVSPGTWIEIEGDPGMNVAISGGICQAGGLGTVAHAVNVIPLVVDAKPGLLTVRDLPVASCLPQYKSDNTAVHFNFT
jgi:4-hydroxy-tetrahydrodipicolinate reductase